MAGAQDIQRYPRGLIDLLGMRATGDTPHQLAQEQTGIVDCTDYYTNDRMQTRNGATSIAINATGTFAFVNVAPSAGEMWLVYGAVVNVGALAAATALGLTPVVSRSNTTFPIPWADPQRIPALEGLMWGRTFERPIIVRPGDNFSINCWQITGVPGVSPSCTVYYCPLNV